jgi:predicted 3-demethylubiquinone-9 3-methyltransferase (glyoxalase superfamily)
MVLTVEFTLAGTKYMGLNGGPEYPFTEAVSFQIYCENQSDDAGKLAKYRDVIEFKNNDHRVMTSHVLGEHGQWHQFMTVNYQRRSQPFR